MNHTDKLAAAARQAAVHILQADALVITAGAGMGVDSGLPDFRGNQGFWEAYPALGKAKLGFMDVASPQTFRSDPALAWGFYGHRLNLYRKTVPHAGFAMLKHWSKQVARGSFVFTSNVDGQFQKSGIPADRIVECHGSIHHLQCLTGCSFSVQPADDFVPEVDEAACRLLNEPPICQSCGNILRPNILMFGDPDWMDEREVLQIARMRQWVEQPRRVVIIEMGAGTSIPTVRNFGERILTYERLKAVLVRINPTEADGPKGTISMQCGALAGLTAIAEVLGW